MAVLDEKPASLPVGSAGFAYPEVPSPRAEERPVAHADRIGEWRAVRKSSQQRKEHGLFLTPVAVPDFMGGRITAIRQEHRVLDPAAGAGVLCCAAVEALASHRPRPDVIELVAYEVDLNLVAALRTVLDHLAGWCQEQHGVNLRIRIEATDFIMANAGALRSDELFLSRIEVEKFDVVIANPPYFKIGKADPRFPCEQGALVERYARGRNRRLIPVKLPDGRERRLSPGRHNEVQRAIVEEFVPRFAPGSHLLYLGDTARKDLFMDRVRLIDLGISITDHDKLPHVVLYDAGREWLFLVEAVTSHGPVSPTRIVDLEVMLPACPAGAVYVSALPDFGDFRKHMRSIAWETEVWLCDTPDHMIHYDGERFLGPRLPN